MAEHDIKALNSLIATTIDSANGFEESARRAQSTGLADQLADLGRDRWAVVSTLQSEVTRMGGRPQQSGSAKAAMHRRWLDLRHAVATSDRAILDEIDNGETYLHGKYEALLQDSDLSEAARRAVTEAFDTVRRGTDRAHTLDQGYAIGLPERTQVNWRNIGTGLGIAAALGGVAYAASRSRGGTRYRSRGGSSSQYRPSAAGSATTGSTATASFGGSSPRPMTSTASSGTSTLGTGTAASGTRGSRRGDSGATRLAASGSDESLDRGLGATGSTGGLGSENTGSMGSFGASGSDDMKPK